MTDRMAASSEVRDLNAALRLDALADLSRPLAVRALREAGSGQIAGRLRDILRKSDANAVLPFLSDFDIGSAFPILSAELRAWGRAADVLRTGNAAFDAVNGCGYWAALENDPEYSDKTTAMIALSNRVVIRLLRNAADWPSFSPLLDLGSGDASFLVGLLEAHVSLEAVAFDLPRQAALADRRLAAAGLETRARAMVGDFFLDPVPCANSYLLKNILHDCDDASALRLLRKIREEIPAGGRLFIIEAFPQPDNRYDIAKLLDLNSLVLVGGRDRHLAAYQDMLAMTGFAVARMHQTGNALTLIEAAPTCG